MKRLFMITALIVLALPTLALACHVTSVNGSADCNGWNLCAVVSFSGGTLQGTLHYQIVILDDQGNEVGRIETSEIVSRPPSSPDGNYTYCFDGVWDGVHQSNGFHVQMCANLNGGTSQSMAFDLSCTVDDQSTSFSHVKALYR